MVLLSKCDICPKKTRNFLFLSKVLEFCQCYSCLLPVRGGVESNIRLVRKRKAYADIFLIPQKAFHCSYTFTNHKSDYLDKLHYFACLLSRHISLGTFNFFNQMRETVYRVKTAICLQLNV